MSNRSEIGVVEDNVKQDEPIIFEHISPTDSAESGVSKTANVGEFDHDSD